MADQAADAPVTFAMYPDLKGKRVLVTAGSLGIGKAAAVAFAMSGAHVAINGRNVDRLTEAVAEIKAMGGIAYAIPGDLAIEAEWEPIVQAAIKVLGGLDVLINNGPGYIKAMFEDNYDAPRAYALAFHINVIAAVGLFNAALPELLKNRGSVVNISSINSERPNVRLGYAPYGVSKAALNNLTKMWALRYAMDGLRVNGVVCASVMTKGLAKLFKRTGTDPTGRQSAVLHAMGRVSTPEEQASAIVFLSSKSAGFITGVNLLVDGGWSVRTHYAVLPPAATPIPSKM